MESEGKRESEVGETEWMERENGCRERGREREREWTEEKVKARDEGGKEGVITVCRPGLTHRLRLQPWGPHLPLGPWLTKSEKLQKCGRMQY